jgi:exonuclease III
MASDEIIKRAKKQWEGLSFWVKGEPNSKGVAVLCRRNLDITIRKVEDGGDGRFFTLDCLIYGQRVRIANVYLTNDAVQRKELIESLTMRVQSVDPMIIGGDFNFIMDIDLDRHAVGQTHTDRRVKSYHTTSVKVFQQLILVYNLIDVFRVFAPDKK